MKLYNNISNKAVAWIAGSLLCASITSCNDFGSMNEDPNKPVSVPSSMLMSGTEKYIMDLITSLELNKTYLYGQQLTETTYTDATRYHQDNSRITENFNISYEALANLNKIIALNSDKETAAAHNAYGANCNQIAAAMTLRAWLMSIMTDMWGDLPYTDALKLEEGIYNTRYDSQKSIYEQLLKELKEASDMFDVNQRVFVSGSDQIYDGDPVRWKRFANSLRCRLAVHLSKVDAHWRDYIDEAVRDGVFASSEDNAYYQFSESGEEYFGFWYHFHVRNRNDFTISKTMVDLMQGLDDPRLPIYATTGNGIVNGMPCGLPNSVAPSCFENCTNWQKNPPFFLKKSFAYPIMTYSELMFILCEAHDYNVDEFRDGVRSSIRRWAVQSLTNITEADAFGYIDRVSARVDAEAVAVQKYIDLYLNGTEAWTELRRTGYPEQVVRPGKTIATVDGVEYTFQPLEESKGDIIRRIKYPSSESVLNHDCWQEAVDRLKDKTNNIYSPMYWDVRTSTYDHPANL